MHIPDGVLDGRTAAAMAVISATGLGLALRHAHLHLPPRRVPLMGLAAAFIFAAQMLNFPVLAGTSGHLVGGVLAAVLLGSSAAFIVIAAVLILQALLFADGGVLALGANIFNMGLVSAVGGWIVYATMCKLLIGRTRHGTESMAAPRSLPANPDETEPAQPADILHYYGLGDSPVMTRGELRARIVAAAFASWLVVVLAAVACAAELALSGVVRWSVVFPAMTHVHMLIGVGEGVITSLVLLAMAQVPPELICQEAVPARGRLREVAFFGVLISLGLALFLTPLASKSPDGLERTSQRLGIHEKTGVNPAVHTPAPAYKFPGISSATLATSVAGAVGTALAFGLSHALGGAALVPKEKR